MNSIKKYWAEQPLKLILLLGFSFRMLSVIFSFGYGMHDDHFLILEDAQEWVDWATANSWYPGYHGNVFTPPNFSFFYIGLHYFFLRMVEGMGLHNPEFIMFILRFIHALYSLLIIYFGYKITEKISNQSTAKQVGLILSLLWFFPILSVRNLVEMVCIPPLLAATWLMLKDEKKNLLKLLFTGFLLGIAFNIRFQTSTFSFAFCVALFFQRKYFESIIVGIGFLFCALLIQGGADYLVWQKPFVQIQAYINYNTIHAKDYFTAPWYNFILVVGGILIPPVSLLLIAGYFHQWKKNLLLFLPAFAFFCFHSYFPNKQERFILPFIPFVIILGIVGWQQIQQSSAFWQRRKKMIHGFWIFFWVLNCIILIPLSVAYTKRQCVESMLYLSHKHDLQNALIVDNSNDNKYTMSPRFYLQKWVNEIGVTNSTDVDALCKGLVDSAQTLHPHYIIFYQTENLEQRKAKYENYFSLTYETTIEPGYIDKIFHWLNPVNDNNVATIYRLSIKPH